MHQDPIHEPFQETSARGVVIERQPITRSYGDSRHLADTRGGPAEFSALTNHWRNTLAGTLAALTALLFLGVLGLGLALTQFNAATAATEGSLPAGVGRNVGLWTAFSLLLSFMLGGYVAGRLYGARRPEHGAWRGALVFLLASPLLLTLILGTLAGLGSSLAATIGGLHVDPTTQARVNPTAVGDLAGHLRDATWFSLLGCVLGLAGSALGGMVTAPRDTMRSDRQARRERVRRDVEEVTSYREPIHDRNRF